MPQFGLRSLLIGFAGLALWLSTFAGYPGADDVRAIILLSILITSGVTAVCHTGRRRAFWAGFFGTVLVTGRTGLGGNYVPRFTWLSEVSFNLAAPIARNGPRYKELSDSIHVTIWLGLMLTIATGIGLLCVYIYDQSRKTENP